MLERFLNSNVGGLRVQMGCLCQGGDAVGPGGNLTVKPRMKMGSSTNVATKQAPSICDVGEGGIYK